MPFVRQTVAIGALILVGCMGDGSQSVYMPESTPGAAVDGGGSSEAHGCDDRTVPPQALRRLNRVELAHSLQALLGSASGVYETLPADDAVLFDNDANAQSVSPGLVEKYEAVFSSLVDKALLAPGSGGTGARERLLVCNPAGGNESACARTILTSFAAQAWRRAPQKTEVDSLVSVFGAARTAGEAFEPGVSWAMKAALLSPRFLFRLEQDQGTGSAPYRIDDAALAVRLSYFLWSTPPDVELSKAASEGRLSDDVELEAQVRRMVKDPKAQALIDNFGVQWLGLRFFESLVPASGQYPAFNDSLRASMREESKRFLASIMSSSRSFLDVLDANTTFVDERLAKHYGIPGVTGTQFREVPLPAGRAGVLTQAAVLMGGSTPTRGSPSKRGHFVLDRMLCRPPPPPPPNVSLEVDASIDPKLPMRDRLKIHRENPSCAGCHAEMDPIGLTFEKFDAVGATRDTHNGYAIDTAGTLPNGLAFSDPQTFAQALKSDRNFAHCVGEQLFSYAMGRAATRKDACAVESVVSQFEQSGRRFEALVVAIVLSEPFRSRLPQAK